MRDAVHLRGAEWHRQRRAAILRGCPEVGRLLKAGPSRATVPLLVVCNAGQLLCALAAPSLLPLLSLILAAVLLGGTLSLWQFALLHDVKHGSASVPWRVSFNDALFFGSVPSLFGYFLYLRFGHLSHHTGFGKHSLREIFDSRRIAFEDGDALFTNHRQLLSGDVAGEAPGFAGEEAVGGIRFSIGRFFLSLWRTADTGPGSPRPCSRASICIYNATLYSLSMCLERIFLFLNDRLVSMTGRTPLFHNKPAAFHATLIAHARLLSTVHLALLLLSGPRALLWLYFAELGWVLPLHPASAMFFSNHPSSPRAGGCQPTGSLYIGGPWGGRWFDLVCCFSNYHTEHHDFPEVPCWRLRRLRDLAAPFYSGSALVGCRDGWLRTVARTFERPGFYACAGTGQGLAGVD